MFSSLFIKLPPVEDAMGKNLFPIVSAVISISLFITISPAFTARDRRIVGLLLALNLCAAMGYTMNMSNHAGIDRLNDTEVANNNPFLTHDYLMPF